MKKGFYTKLAWEGIRKNKRLYMPYILTCTGMVMMFYIIAYLAESPLLLQMRGGETMATIMSLGRGVICIFALIFLFYTNSFLVRRRNKEFGLYNILGMNKRNISRILLWETLMTAIISLALGLFVGIAFSKLAELGLVNVLQAKVSYDLSIAPEAIWQTAAVFAVIFFLILLSSLGRVHLSNPLSLLKSENKGEKPPKSNWLFAFLGVAILGAAYYLAVSIDEPITAMMMFFVAVVMVIGATYLIFIAGSVALCKLLQKSKKYYYKPNHFVSVSSMVYRMKRNGAGLASICILSTMVLVMLSSTGSLYIGAEDALNTMYPHDFSTGISLNSPEALTEELKEVVRGAMDRSANGQQKNVTEYSIAGIAGLVDKNGNVDVKSEAIWSFDLQTFENVRDIYILSLSEYNSIMGTNETLKSGEALIYSSISEYPYDTITISDCKTLEIKKNVSEMPTYNGALEAISSIYVIVSDWQEYLEPLIGLTSPSGLSLLQTVYFYSFDMDDDYDTQLEIYEKMRSELRELSINGDIELSYSVECLALSRDSFYSLYGSLFFLGILLSIVFIFAAVLIIYYKQISEGYEDQTRFEIMQKVGMTKHEIRRSINSQVLTIFFMPLFMAGLHLAFAFPMIWKMIQYFGIHNLNLLILVNVGCFLVFGLLYTLVYKATSNSYYKIVSE